MEIVLGLILVAAGTYFSLFYTKKISASTLEIKVQDTKTVAQVREALEAMASIDPNYRELVEVKGTAASESPVKTPYTGQTVAYYTAKTVQVSETTETYQDANGNRRTRKIKHNDTLAEEESGVPLLLRDENGDELTVETMGVSNKLDLQKTCDRMDTAPTYMENRPYSRVHQFTVNHGSGYRIIGYKKVEETIPLGAPLYTLGEAYLQNGKIMLGVPADSAQPFIVTTKSEKQLLESQKNKKNMATFGGIAAAVIGILLIVAAIA